MQRKKKCEQDFNPLALVLMQTGAAAGRVAKETASLVGKPLWSLLVLDSDQMLAT